jgi:hypothetical protein
LELPAKSKLTCQTSTSKMESSTFVLMPAPPGRQGARRALGKSRSKTRKSGATMQHKRGSAFITPSRGEADPENRVDTKRRRLDKHNFIGSVVGADRGLDTVTEGNMLEGVDEDLAQASTNSGGARFYRNTDLWLVGELSNKLTYSGALYCNSSFATEQMKTRLAQLEQQDSDRVYFVSGAGEQIKETEIGNGLLATLASVFQRIAMRLPFFG